MSKDTTLVVLGVWITFLPYLGIPSSWKTTLFVLTGLILVLLGLAMRRDALRRGARREAHRPFVENTDVHSTTPPDRYDRKEGITSLN